MDEVIAPAPGDSPPTAALTPDRRDPLRDCTIGAFLFCLGAAVYLHAINGGFIWNDDQMLTANPQVHEPHGWLGLWFWPRTVDYFPLSSSTFWLQWQFSHMAAMGYHAVNLLLHGAVAVLTWLTLRRLGVPGALLAAALFSVHPVCTETVAWISERVNLLSQLFLLLSIILYFNFAEGKRRGQYFAAFICFLLAMLAKSTVVMLPVIILLLLWWRRELDLRRDLIRLSPFFVVALVLGVVTIYFHETRAIGDTVIPNGNILQRLVSAMFAAGFYFYTALWPFNLNHVYPEWTRAFSMPSAVPEPHLIPPSPDALPYWIQILPGIAIIAAFALLWPRREQSWARAAIAGLGAYFIAILPVLGLVTMSYTRVSPVANHFQYLALPALIGLVVAAGLSLPLSAIPFAILGILSAVLTALQWHQTSDDHIQQIVFVAALCLVSAACLVGSRNSRNTWQAFIACVLLCFTTVSWAHASIFQSEETLFSYVLTKNPNSWQACNHLGAALYMRGDIKDAHPLFKRAVELNPDDPESHNNLALVESYGGNNVSGLIDRRDAIKQFQLAVRIKDDSAMETNLANAYEEQGNYGIAIETYKHALKLQPTNASAWCNMGYAQMRTSKTYDAIQAFMNCIELDPNMPQGRQNLNQSLRTIGIDPNGPAPKGKYPFDVAKALQLLKDKP